MSTTCQAPTTKPRRRSPRWTDGLRYLEHQHGWNSDVVMRLARLCLGEPIRADVPEQEGRGL